ncbi:N-acetylmuramoyl-L-alanine amidase [Eubacterium sp. AF15-50]|uniref:peptidoglycan recognition protein family protein n=1 Tax=unclassified Eubacterium (in: firmicutes) TaxID=2624479 RepID=UPI000E49B583|nr:MULTISPECIES: peptidoglycan recognition family protein [unclassified Eubacterium (in: firmicutes)]RHR71943.1 N-acetylmuramoyl-L-alanine amidase [Eubacterium sp. AF16-48]RHR79433.1 N-acetylmuramoyl-L-alanine amidase [Eubacterium sp. AF15-50]
MAKKSKRKRKLRKGRIVMAVIIVAAIVIMSCLVVKRINQNSEAKKVKNLAEIKIPDWIDSQIIDVDGASRNGYKLKGVKDIVVHYVGNPGTTAQQNHNFYAGDQSNVSSHFVVGLDGEIIQCIPINEWSAASNWRNNDTISIEVCHPDETGKFKKKTYSSLVKLVAWLENVCDIDESHVIRHYDITKKECPRYFVQHEDKWKTFKKNVEKYRLAHY